MHQHVSGDGGEALQLEDGVHNLVLYLHDGTHSILLKDAALCQKIHLCLKTGNLLPDFQIAHTILKLKSIVIPPQTDRPEVQKNMHRIKILILSGGITIDFEAR